MSITDELREYASTRISPNKGKLTAIADRIDAEHERECKEQYACGAEHGIGASIDASMIQTHGYVELPKDADGVTWRLGDRDEDGGTVTAIKLCLDGFWIRVGCTYRIAKQVRHYQPDTWERIIEDAVRLGFTDPDNESLALKLIARCKELAGDSE